MTIYYEWDVEVITSQDTAEFEKGEVAEHFHQASYADCVKQTSQPIEDGCEYQIVLVRDDDKGRSWAYLKDGKLPPYFADSYGNNVAKVPQKFHKEISK